MARICDRCKRTDGKGVGRFEIGVSGVLGMGMSLTKFYRDADLCVECRAIIADAAFAALENRVPGVPTYTMRPRWHQRELATSALCMILGGFLGPFICWAGMYLFHLLRR